LQVEAGLTEELPIEEGDGRSAEITGSRRQAAFDEQMVHVGADLLRLQLIGRASVEGGETENRGHVALDRAWRELAELHLADKTFS
jgi:hypothetical protein